MSEMINLLGDLLANQISISSAASRGLLKLSIKDEMGPFTPLEGLKIEDFQKVIENSLKIRLKKLDVKESEKIIEELKQSVKDAQSLILMSEI